MIDTSRDPYGLGNFKPSGVFTSFGGMRIVESPHALQTAEPKRPRTGDMCQMIDDLTAAGMPPVPKTVPASFMFQGQMVAHPDIVAELRRKAIRNMADHMDRAFMREVFS